MQHMFVVETRLRSRVQVLPWPLWIPPYGQELWLPNGLASPACVASDTWRVNCTGFGRTRGYAPWTRNWHFYCDVKLIMRNRIVIGIDSIKGKDIEGLKWVGGCHWIGDGGLGTGAG